MRSKSKWALAAAFVAAIVVGGGHADAAVVFQLQLPLTDQAATNAAIGPYGGTISGGQFGLTGWTTTARSNIIVVPLPAGLDTQHGRLVFSVQNFEWNVTTQYWEQWALVALDGFGPPLGIGSAGHASVLTLYRGWHDTDPTKGYHLVGYLDLFDPSCATWQDCTAEAKTPHFWLQQTGQIYTAQRQWQGQGDTMTFSGTSTVIRSLDLSATSSGTISAPQLYLMINACGGSTTNQCGPWDGPTNLKGGPIGVTYSDLTLEIYGPDPPDAGVSDAGVADAAPADAGVAPNDASASADAARPDADVATDADTAPGGDAAVGDPGTARGGCSCRSGGSTPRGYLAMLGLLLLILFVRRRSQYAVRSGDGALCPGDQFMRYRMAPTVAIWGGLAAALLLFSGCDSGTTPEPEPEPVTGVVGGCEMTYSETDAGISTCLCSNDGITAGATVSAYRVEPQHSPDGGLNLCPLSSEGQPPTASAVTDAEGRYALSVPPGRYSIFHTAGCADGLPSSYRYYYSCEDVTEPLTLDINPCHGIGCLPNLYLYPSRPMVVSVRLAEGWGAALLTQHPPFDDANRWDVYVEPGSRILGSPPGFLFYEARVGQPYKPTTGWVVPPHGFRPWAERTLTDLGWPARPQQDFLDAWSARLDRDHAVAIRFLPPRWVDERVGLIIDPVPDHIHRHWFLLERARPGDRLQPPTLPPFDNAPSTLTVLEWGVIDHLSRP